MKKIRGRGCGDRSLSKNLVQVGWLSTRIVQLKPFKMPRNTLRIYRNIFEKYTWSSFFLHLGPFCLRIVPARQHSIFINFLGE